MLNWKLIIQLSFFGLAMGIATVYVIPSNIEPLFWGLIFVVSAYLIAKHCQDRLFLHAFLVGIANGLWITVIHVLLFDRYVANHPEEMAMMANISKTGSERLMVPIISLVFGVLSGILLGLFAVVAGRFIAARKM